MEVYACRFACRPGSGGASRARVWVRMTARELHALYCKHFEDRRKERQLLSTGSFFVTFAAVRAITHAIRAERGPFKNITPGGRHLHHMTCRGFGLREVGYLWRQIDGVNQHT